MGQLMRHLTIWEFPSLFSPGEYNHATGLIYTALLSAVNDKADKMIIKKRGFEWYIQDQHMGKYLGGNAPEPDPSYRENLYKIIERDNIIRNHISIILDNDEEVILQILST